MTKITQLAVVDFHGKNLTVITGKTGEHLVAMRPVCEAIGLGWQSQYNRIRRHKVLSEGVAIMNTPTAGGEQSTICLPLEMLNGWLFGIDAGRCRKEIRPVLIKYQRECYSALAAYWQQGVAINPRKTKCQPKALTNDQQDAIKALVKARVEAMPKNKQAKAAITCLSSLKSKFGCTYKEIAPEHFTEAVSLVARVTLEGELLQKEESKGVVLLDAHDAQQIYLLMSRIACMREHCKALYSAAKALQSGPLMSIYSQIREARSSFVYLDKRKGKELYNAYRSFGLDGGYATRL